MRYTWMAMVVMVLSSGCMHTQLGRQTSTLERTQTGMQYRQVMDNLAMVANNPDTLPSWITISGGVSQVVDTGEISSGLTWNPFTLVMETMGLRANRGIQGNWQMSPIHDADRLEAMRCAYQRVLAVPPTDERRCSTVLKRFLHDDAINARLKSGWVCVGCKRDVPHNACYVSHCGSKYVWVMPSGMEGLTQLTLAIVDIANVLPISPPAEKTATLEISRDAKGNLTGTKLTATVKAPTEVPLNRPLDSYKTQLDVAPREIDRRPRIDRSNLLPSIISASQSPR